MASREGDPVPRRILRKRCTLGGVQRPLESARSSAH